ncbi:phytanoyl-CoA dioxygenase family protein [Niabella hibiscisoli]|uniref:phytanoyl-CoA dioxygenase family protein n=1 Tax=Niabella hibiscisoli TaxID=1825928 RepID=UPI001F11330F|nr:phytanoyl-CoA dioxygenase family protein [Niabella hibiscisoli]MCH5717393.1 phytanoyl-CoA dioxygenase family protein [Niabella hibiscisoli]
MDELIIHKAQIAEHGFSVIESVYTNEEVDAVLQIIGKADTSKDTFRQSNDLFAIRQFLKELPDVLPVLLNGRLKALISNLLGTHYFIVKSIYFDKPESSNWFVAYHQDLTISVDRKTDIPGFGPWTVKQNQFAVQPPLSILENNFTLRIHLDNTTEENGALKVVPGSHLKGVYRPETIDWTTEREVSCAVPEGGVMIMKPLLLHSSGRTTNNNKRRVVHIEFSATELPQTLQWSERINLDD